MNSSNDIMLNGNEAVAYAAMDSRVKLFSHYPGSPVNKVEPALKSLNSKHGLGIAFNDAHNEHIAALSAMGASFSQARSMLVMKHVGLNIAADPLCYAGYTGVKGGMLIIVGTDPGANSSTGEQDVHWYAKSFNFPLFEPTSVQEIYDNCLAGYKLSEEYEIPVFIFIPVELAHTIANIKRSNLELKHNDYRFNKDRKRYINVGQKTIANHQVLLEKIDNISKKNQHYKSLFNPKAKVGIVTRGLGFNYVLESILKLNIQEEVALLQFDLVFPIQPDLIIEFAKNKDLLLFVEDQDGFMETMIKQNCFNELDCRIHGKDIFPSYGALDLEQVTEYLASLFGKKLDQAKPYFFEVEERLGTFCEGCPHTASYYGIFDALKDIDYVLGGDIGCSSLAPFKADWLLCMNAGIGVSQGISQVSPDQLIVSTGGDGSFFHGGMISLQSAVENNINLVHIVFDNSYVAMTGHQYSPSGGTNFNIEKFLVSIGVERIHIVDVFEKNKLRDTLQSEIGKSGVRVIWAKGACALVSESQRKEPHSFKLSIDNLHCDSCNLCYEELACPAIKRDHETSDLFVDENLCVRCGTCHSICPNDSISFIDLQIQ